MKYISSITGKTFQNQNEMSSSSEGGEDSSSLEVAQVLFCSPGTCSSVTFSIATTSITPNLGGLMKLDSKRYLNVFAVLFTSTTVWNDHPESDQDASSS